MTQSSNTSLQFVFSCPLPSGLHARPASHMAEVANQFSSDCILTNLRNGLVANGKSVLGIIAADIRKGDRCALHVQGPDEQFAHDALRRFIEQVLPHFDVPLAGISPTIRTTTPPRVLLAANVICVFGAPVSRGIGHGKVVILGRMRFPPEVTTTTSDDSREEMERIKEAVRAVRHKIGEKLKHSLTPTGRAVLQADLAMAGDVFLMEKLSEEISSGKSAAQAVLETGKFFIDLLGRSESEYIRQRSADIQEICLQLLESVMGTTPATTKLKLIEPSVLVAESLAPQQLLELDRRWLKAIVLEHSGSTSHAAILARSLGIPTIAGGGNSRLLLTEGRDVVVDANRGMVAPFSSPPVQRFYERERRTLERRRQASLLVEQSAVTTDGTHVEVAANASSGEEVIVAFDRGADGIGLFRTEMIYLGRESAPSEDEQFAIYSEATRSAGGRPVIIRTFDIGGDKNVPYLNIPHEDNPFLGFRGVRIYAGHRDLLQTQLRAILRSSAVGMIQIMAPMISTLEELVDFKAAVSAAKKQLVQEGVAFQPDIKIGMMIEVPSVAFILDQLFAEVDFFSIGTNDLCQYFFAADRSNPAIASVFPVRHPAFLRFLKELVEPIRRAGKWIGMCGEMAGELRNLPLLLGLGLDEISVPAADVDEFKRAIAKFSAADSARVLEQAISCRSAAEVDALLASQPIHHPEPLLSEDLVLLGSTSRTREEVIQEMVDAFYVASRTDDRHLLEEALWAREAMGSTGLGDGFAIPHCKTNAVSANSICVLRLKEPIQWDSEHGELVSMVVLLALRDSEGADTHMQVFSALARKLINDDFRQYLLKVETPDQITAYLSEQLGLSLMLGMD
jgi:phosphoenolpyruvate-protein phosphotransferase